MASDLPTDFDFIVLGTGLTETILAAAFSRIGHKVLHLDRNDHYSDYWASFNLKGFEKLAQCSDKNDIKKEITDIKEKIKDGESIVELPQVNSLINDLKIQFYVQDKPLPEDEVTVQSLSISPKDTELTNDTSSTQLPIKPVSCLPSKDFESYKPAAGIESFTPCKIVESFKPQDIVESFKPSGALGSTQSSTENLESYQPANIMETFKPSEQLPEIVPEHRSTVDKILCDTPSDHVSPSVTAACQAQAKSSIEEVLPVKQRKIWTKDEIEKSWRSFNLDLSPKVLYSSGKMVELLISSDVAKYCEFRTVSRVLTQNDSLIEKIPCSRADVFSSKDVSMLDKRKLMKFLEWCAGYHKNPEAYKEYEDKTFHEVLKARNLSENLQNIIQNAIAMVTEDASVKQGLEKTQIFLQSVGRYGNTPFLFPLYGSGELPQAFCRLCAVFGGTYCLMTGVNSISIDQQNKCQAIITNAGQRINCKWLIMGTSYSPEKYLQTQNTKKISRCILLTDRSLLQTDTQELSLLWMPPLTGTTSQPVSVLELPQSAMVCPKDMYLVHLSTTSCHDDPQLDFLPFIQNYFNLATSQVDTESIKPLILWSAYFTQPHDVINEASSIPDNVFIIAGPDSDIDMDMPADEARRIFEKICPDEIFLPKPPHPDDIIYVDESEATSGGGETWNGQKVEGETKDKLESTNKDQGQKNKKSAMKGEKAKEKDKK